MILVDTSVWIDHLRKGDARLIKLLHDAQVLTHPFVVGEIALGQLRQRREILEGLQNLPMSSLASDPEVLSYIETRRLGGTGIGYVDAHLLASASLTPGTRIWTRDKRLKAAAHSLNLVDTEG
ncbi:MAG: type II toxin-antitoxin system VapC family toxin [Proteobacteria bacterium]|nr:type II toxin-antitoxin system VapC family toxin [Pseudomonadota bacterium]